MTQARLARLATGVPRQLAPSACTCPSPRCSACRRGGGRGGQDGRRGGFSLGAPRYLRQGLNGVAAVLAASHQVWAAELVPSKYRLVGHEGHCHGGTGKGLQGRHVDHGRMQGAATPSWSATMADVCLGRQQWPCRPRLGEIFGVLLPCLLLARMLATHR